MDGHAAGLAQGLVVEARLAHLEQLPVLALELLVDVDDVEVAVLAMSLEWLSSERKTTREEEMQPHHPQLMHVVAHDDRPVLGGIRVLADLLRDLVPDDGLLREPLAGRAGHGMLWQHQHCHLREGSMLG